MKKVLFCAAVLAVAASCTDELDTASMQQTQQTPGIVFTTGDDAVTTRGEYEEVDGSYYPFWTAEKDRISVFSLGTTSKSGSTKNESWTDKDGFNGTKVSYKATRSERNAYFTGVSDDDILDFAETVTEEKPAKFVAIYPTTDAGATAFKTEGTDEKTETVTFDLPTLGASIQTQTNTAGLGIYGNIAKYAVVNGYAEADNKAAVGENIPLHFTRLNPAIVYQTKGLDDYTDEFGVLKSIKLESNGILDENGKATAKKSIITQKGSVTITIESDKNGVITDVDHEIDNEGKGSAMTVQLGESGTGLEWSDDARAYMAIANVERVDNSGKAYTEEMAVTYTFKNITIKETVNTSASWTAPDFYNYKTLDVNAYPYLVFDNTKDYSGAAQTGEYTLLLNSGELAQIFDKSGAVKMLDGTTIAVTAIKKVIAKPELTATDFASLVKMTGVEQVILENQTSIPANAFEGLTSIERLEMPKVTTIDKAFLGKKGSLASVKYLNLAAYKFDGNGDNTTASTVNQALFANKLNMDYVDLSALEDMTPVFGYPEAQISFQNCTALDSVKVNNLKLRANSFSGCTSLQKVNGSVDVSEGYAAFQGCNNEYTSGFDITAKDNKKDKLYTLTLASTNIAEDAFNGCTYLSDIVDMEGNQIAPTEIGARAFTNVLALQYMDLSKASEIGESAFEGAQNYEATSSTNDIVTVIVPTVKYRTFVRTAIKKIEFTEATSFENFFLSGSKNIVHVKFAKPFTVTPVTEWANNLFGPTGTAGVTLFYAEGQQYLSGRTLTLPQVNADGEAIAGKAYNFGDVQKN